MRKIIAEVVTWEALHSYFGGTGWEHLDIRKDRMTGSSRNLSFNIEPEKVLFSYNVFNVDDKSDSEKGISDEPLKNIAKFLAQDLPGGEFFTKRSNRPDIFSNHLKLIACSISNNKSKIVTSKILKRIACNIKIANIGINISNLVGVYRFALSSDKAFKELYQKIKEKGWDVHSSDNDGTLRINLGDEFEANIEIYGIQYHYIFQVSEHPDLTESGITYNPIVSFRNFYKSEKVSNVIKGVNKVEKTLDMDDDGSKVDPDKIPRPPKLPNIDVNLNAESGDIPDPFGETINAVPVEDTINY